MTAFLPWCIFAMMPMAVDAFNWVSEQLFDGLGLVNACEMQSYLLPNPCRKFLMRRKPPIAAAYPHIFHDLDEKQRKAARAFLSQSVEESPGCARERVFNLDAAKLLYVPLFTLTVSQPCRCRHIDNC
jgi:hypothetical protein